MNIRRQRPDLAAPNRWSDNTLARHLDIRLAEIGDDFISGTMPVDSRARRPFGMRRGGASAALAIAASGCKSTPTTSAPFEAEPRPARPAPSHRPIHPGLGHSNCG